MLLKNTDRAREKGAQAFSAKTPAVNCLIGKNDNKDCENT